MHKTKRPRRLIRILMLVCAVGLLCSAALLFRERREYAAGDAAYRQVRQQVRRTEDTDGGTGTAAAGESADGEEAREDGVDFDALAAVNSDAVGWLTCAGTAIDYPVVRGTDNDYYLDHLFTGGQSRVGAIFMDYRNAADFSDRNTVLYGHNMRDGSMFAALLDYRDQSAYDESPAMTLQTPGGDYVLQLVAGVYLDGNTDVIPREFADDSAFLDYVAGLRASSTFVSDTAVAAGDRLVTLCTCAYVFSNARYALVGKLTPAD